MEKEKVSITEWSANATKSFYDAIKASCPRGMDYACDGRCLVRDGAPMLGMCRYHHNGICVQENILRARLAAEMQALKQRRMKEVKNV